MCGIFGIISSNSVNTKSLKTLIQHSRQRGRDSSGLVYLDSANNYIIERADFDIVKLLRKSNLTNSEIVFGHSRLITNGLNDNQPIIRDDLILIHNGIIVNHEEIWNNLGLTRLYRIDSEIILALFNKFLEEKISLEKIPKKIFQICDGTMSCAVAIPKLGKMIVFSNCGSLYHGIKDQSIYFASERYALDLLHVDDIEQINGVCKVFDIPVSDQELIIRDYNFRKENLIPEFRHDSHEEALLEYEEPYLKRCTRCILPHTMPFIKFDENGVCNYCHSYKLRNVPKPTSELFELVEPYRRPGNELDCIVPFSGGRDSCYALHLIVKELKMKPVTYTYDWGMVTDLGRRNISRVCSRLGVENIIVAADISKKRQHIRTNLKVWLKSPHLGLIALLTAGDKHFFRYVEVIKKQTGINLNLWGFNPLEVTHFKTGFLGIPPDFEEKRVYSHGIRKQIRYHKKRFLVMSRNLGYFNSSLWDTLSGEYYRSFTEKKDYFHIFDYWRWEEEKVNDTLINEYDWELSVDTPTTWRIGDGTAAFYNYIYFTVAGFTEHDTFRSNQIREGQLSRDVALKLVKEENKPRYKNIRWYLDALNLDFKEVINVINSIPKLY
ncbi:hypothetical protein TASI_0391 [Taylorella asinigenitalis MCE3]|uniref:Glutamine--fructose-6-phosphate aminotransferase [isomerizing] n=1 Tax=Taylorella asinigenitalis (strain MCE3) TaxID=1008459 RepID=G4QCN7_TAYAM|nr:hypothetical protein TASI_0391 [Taylorella asinigenitalis MCE3]